LPPVDRLGQKERWPKGHKEKDMRKFLTAGLAVAMLAVPAVSQAAQPANPGCFGTDRAANLHNAFIADGGAYSDAPGASAWGAIAGDRAALNGDMNREYKAASYCGQYTP
jgi:hypothetical protein